MRQPVVRAGAVLLACGAMAFTPMGFVPAAFAQQRVAADVKPGSAITELMARPVTLQLDHVPLKRALAEIASHADVLIQYQAEELTGANVAVTLQASKMPLGDVLLRALKGTNLQAVPAGADIVTITRTATVAAAQGVITGLVTSAKTKQPLANVTVTLDDATHGVMTGQDGTFRLPASAGEHKVTVRGVGFVRQIKAITVAADQAAALSFALEPSANVLDQVIVTGTVVATERKAIPTPITVVTAEDIEKRGITRIDQLFRGEIPGVISMERGSAVYADEVGAMATSQVYARGSSGISESGTTTPLKTFIDGIELVDPSYLGTIDPSSIARIEIITGPQAATIYGSGALGGVMQIFTKKGNTSGAPDMTLSLKYGTLQSNLTESYTPTHTDGLSIAGGSGPEFSYSGNLSYNYSGQWQPFLYSRTLGASVGATHTRGPFTVSGSVSTTSGKNGTTGNSGSLLHRVLNETGEWWQDNFTPVYHLTGRTGRSSSQTVSLNVDHRITSFWQHHLTVGRSQTSFEMQPDAPVFKTAGDSLYRANGSSGQRTSATYNTTVLGNAGIFNSSLTLGANGATGSQLSVSGCLVASTATSYVACSQYEAPAIGKPMDSDSWGGFGTWRLGMFDRLYVTFGLRAERNPNYGNQHKVDWTPTNGIAYTQEFENLTVKLLGSYGRATRAPSPDRKLEVRRNNANYNPSVYVTQVANPNLTPEYSSGPEGGIEMYYGNVGSLTVNHYRQTISDLIMAITVDSVLLTTVAGDYSTYSRQYQYMNVAKTRQTGWEMTGGLNLGPLGLKGTYTWMDARRLSVHPSVAQSYPVGASFVNIPSHTGSMSATYARGGTSMTVVMNYIGSVLRYGDASPVRYAYSNGRIKTYIDRWNTSDFYLRRVTRPGYVKSDLAVSQRITPWASATLNMFNAGNSFRNDMPFDFNYPTLGRQTSLGISVRYPRSR